MSGDLIIGCGYTGRRLAGRLARERRSVTGVVSSAGSALELQDLGVSPLVLDLDAAASGWPPLDQGRIFYLAPPPDQGTSDHRLQRFLENLRLRTPAPRIVYTSTTGVYGDCGGDLVDEARPLNPTTDRARRRADAERQLLDWSSEGGGEVVILRVAGIYGPGRVPVEYVRGGNAVLRDEDAPFSNRIHVDDLVTACIAAMERGVDGRAYNVSDGHPSRMGEFYDLIADLTGRPRPPRITSAEAAGIMSPGMLSFLRENRRIDNGRLRNELGVVLKHPSFREGIPSSLDDRS
ncbi:MAG: SDR family oxidoreductase [Candidatus Krumholzibacteriia bacterium]